MPITRMVGLELTRAFRGLSPSCLRKILHIAVLVSDKPISVQDIHLVEKIWVYANKSSVSVEDCWVILESLYKDESTLEKLLRTAAFITLLFVAEDNPSKLEWSRIVDNAFAPCLNNLQHKECYRQRLVFLCPTFIHHIWNAYKWEEDTFQKVFQLLDILEREDFRVILRQLLERVSKQSGGWKAEQETKNIIEPFDFVMKTNHILGSFLQLQINQLSHAKLCSYRTIITFWKLAICSPQHTLYQICNTAILRKGDLSKYLSLVKELDLIASFEWESSSPCLLIDWLRQTLLVVVDECKFQHSYIPSQVAVEALYEWTSLLMQGTSPLVDPVLYIYYVLVPLPIVEKWISQRMYDKLDIIASLLGIVEKVLHEYYFKYNQMIDWGLYSEEKEVNFRLCVEDSIFGWLRDIFERRWLIPFSLGRKFVDFMYTFLRLPRTQHLKDAWTRWMTNTNSYSTRVLLYCLYCGNCGVPLSIPFTFDYSSNHSMDRNTLTYLYLRELVSVGEVSEELGRQALSSFYQVASHSLTSIEKELVRVRVPIPIAQSICTWESSEQLWYLVLLQKLIYLSCSELERLAFGLLTCAVDLKIWKDSIEPWIKHIYETNASLLSSREDVVAFIAIGKFFQRLLPHYFRIDKRVLLTTCEDADYWKERNKYVIQMVSHLIQTFSRNIPMTSKYVDI
jgi:hypothetical protein